MDFRILGPLEIWRGDGLVPVSGERRRAVLAMLLLSANRVVSAEQLIDGVWGDQPPDTGSKALQMQISALRKALAPASDRIIETEARGYRIAVPTGALDLDQFETWVHAGEAALSGDQLEVAVDAFTCAVGLWRGPPLVEFGSAPFARAAAGRLEELRLRAYEKKLAAELSLGRHSDIVPELRALVAEHPYRERLWELLLLGLYRSGRQAEALDAYREARSVLVDEVGVDPGPELRRLEQAILRQDPQLELSRTRGRPSEALGEAQRSILVVPTAADRLEELLTIAVPLARRPRREIIATMLVEEPAALTAGTDALERHRVAQAARGVPIRIAVFTSEVWGAEIVRLAAAWNVDLLVVDSPPELLETGALPSELERVLADSPCDVAIYVSREGRRGETAGRRSIFVPFGGADHEWSAVEVGAWIAAAEDATLHLVGARSEHGRDRRDSSRLLAGVSLVVQRAAGVAAKPVLVPAGDAGVIDAVADGDLLVVGLSDRWRTEGLGQVRLGLARSARPPVLLVRRGVRPSVLAPAEQLSRYTWSIADVRGMPMRPSGG